MFSRVELKVRGRMAFRRNYGSAVAVTLLMEIITLIFGSRTGINFNFDLSYYDGYGSRSHSYALNSLINELRYSRSGLVAGILGGFALVLILCGILLLFFVQNVLIIGGSRFFILNQTGRPGFGVLLDGFKSGHYGNLVTAMFLKDLFIGLWSLLLVIPGIIKSYEYMMVPYILAENPGMDWREAFLISKQMMDGQKWNAFVLDLSFLGWYLLSCLTCGILAIFFVNPYKEATHAELYSFNKMRAYQAGYIH